MNRADKSLAGQNPEGNAMEILEMLIEFTVKHPAWTLILIAIVSFVIVAEFKNWFRGPEDGR